MPMIFLVYSDHKDNSMSYLLLLPLCYIKVCTW